MSRVDPNGDGPLASGRPFANTSVYLLGSGGNEVAPGGTGEIHVVGVGVARGYLNQAGMTAARFVETPFGRAYRSNDLGRWNENGEMESMGRVNDVVKVSGQAVSLGEIEQTLLRHGAVRSAAALQHEGKLIAFVESDRADHTPPEDWRGFLSKTLPAYMLPAQVMATARMPVNSYGKVDRQALLALAGALEAAETRHGVGLGAPPEGDLERRVAAIWEECLNVRPVRREDNFFALGGSSLLSIAIAQRLQALGYPVSPQTILISTTVATLAEKIAQATEQASIPAAPDACQGTATAGQEDFWIAWKLGLANTGSQIARVLAVLGAAPEPDRWQSAWTRLVERHAALRTAFLEGADDQVLWRTVEAEQLATATEMRFECCETPAEARERIAARASAPFDLTSPPLARAGLVQVAEDEGEQETLFWFTLHHSVVDGLSARILQEEIHALLLEQPLPPASNGIAEAGHAERQYLASGLVERDRAWWREKLDALEAEAYREIATDRRRPAVPSGTSAAAIVERLDAATVAALTSLARAQHVGLHALLLTLLGAEARRRDGRRSAIVGTGISVRPPGADRAVGYFVNVPPVILTSVDAQPLAEQIRSTQTALTETVEHGAYPASLLYREFRQRHPGARDSRTSLFDISLTSNPSRTTGDLGADLRLTPRCLPGEVAHPAGGVDLAFSHEPVADGGGGLELALVFDPDVYSADTAQAWLGSLADWALWLAADIGRADAPLPALLPEEASSIARWESGPAIVRPAKRFHEFVENLAARHPQRPAVVTESGVASYGELDARANRIARALLAAGVAHEEPVAVLTECRPICPRRCWESGRLARPICRWPSNSRRNAWHSWSAIREPPP